MMNRTLLAALFLSGATFSSGAEAPRPSRPEVRALWVDGFHAGIRSQNEVEELVAHATRTHLNTLFIQVRRRGDALYTGGIEPSLDDPNYSPDFDGLAAIVTAGHKSGLKVHAWINAMPVWRDEAPPKDPRHVFNQHGPDRTGPDNNRCFARPQAAPLHRVRSDAERFDQGQLIQRQLDRFVQQRHGDGARTHRRRHRAGGDEQLHQPVFQSARQRGELPVR